MKVSSVKLTLHEEEILKGLNEFIDLEGLKFNNLEVGELINVHGSYKKGVEIPFTAVVGLGNVIANKVKVKIFDVKVAKIGVFAGIKNIILKQVGKKTESYGVEVEGDVITVDLDTIIKLIPNVNMKVKNISLVQGQIVAEVEDLVYSKDKETLKPQEEKIIYEMDRKTTEDSYTKFRAAVDVKIPNKYESIKEYAMLIPDIAALLWRLFKDPRVDSKTKAKVAAVAGYLAIPIDILPDFIPFVGQIDDIAIGFYGLNTILNEVPEEIILENWQGKGDIILIVKKGVKTISNYVGADKVNKLGSYIKRGMEKMGKKVEITHNNVEENND